MCIAILSTAHPSYALILLNNRDEIFSRPTARAAFWPAPHSHVLGGRDLLRPAHGTWLGLTRAGRLTLLTNFREEGEAFNASARSRGEIPNMYLTAPLPAPPGSSDDGAPLAFAEKLVQDKEDADGPFRGVGGFSLIFGLLRSKGVQLGVISNRTTHAGEIDWLFDGDGGANGTAPRGAQGAARPPAKTTHGCACALSNSHYGDRSWPKVVSGEALLQRAIAASVEQEETKPELLRRCFDILSTDTLPRREPGQEFSTYTYEMRKSILIPPVGGEDRDERDRTAGDFYGTQKQTVVLVGNKGDVTFVERTLYDEHAQSVPVHDQYRSFEFPIEGWEE